MGHPPSKEENGGELFSGLSVTTEEQPAVQVPPHKPPSARATPISSEHTETTATEHSEASAFSFINSDATNDTEEPDSSHNETKEDEQTESSAFDFINQSTDIAASETVEDTKPLDEKPSDLTNNPNNEVPEEDHDGVEQEPSSHYTLLNDDTEINESETGTLSTQEPEGTIQQTAEETANEETTKIDKEGDESVDYSLVPVDAEEPVEESEPPAALESLLQTRVRSLQDVQDEEDEIKQKTDELHRKLAELQNYQSSLEKEQVKAMEEEQWELADSTTQKLAACRQEIETIENEILHRYNHLLQLHEEKCNILEAEVKSTMQELERLRNEEDTHLSSIEQLSNELKTRAQQLDEDLASQEEDLESESKHIDLDLQTVEEKQAKIDAQIYEQTQSLREEKNEWVAKLDAAEAEIEKLMELIRQKQEEKAAYAEKISEIDAKMDAVRSKFEKDLTKIAQTREQIDSKKKAIEQQRSKLEEEKLRGQRLLEQLQQNQKEVEEALCNVHMEAEKKSAYMKEMKMQLAAAEEAKGKMKTAIESAQHHYNLIRSMQDETTVLETEINELTQNSRNIQQEIVSKKAKLQSIAGVLLPELERNKSAAIKAKDFKEAGRLHNEIKSHEAEVQSLEKSISELTETASSIDRQLEDKQEKLNELTAAIKKQQKAYGDMVRQFTMT